MVQIMWRKRGSTFIIKSFTWSGRYRIHKHMVRSADVELVFPAPFEMIWWLSGYATDKTPYATKPMYFMYTETMLQFNEYTKHKFGCLYCCISFPVGYAQNNRHT